MPNVPTYDLDASQLATWLREQAGDRWWTVDGDDSLATAVDLPCDGVELGRVLDARGGRLRVFLPSDSPPPTELASDLGSLAEVEDGAYIFQFAWLTEGQPGEPWNLAEDPIARDAARAVEQGT